MGRPRFTTFAEVFNELEKQLKHPLLYQNETIWSVDDVAEELGYQPRTIQNLISQDKIPHHKVNGKVLFLKGEIIQWIKNDGLYQYENRRMVKEGKSETDNPADKLIETIEELNEKVKRIITT